jgi:hypothetical protein
LVACDQHPRRYNGQSPFPLPSGRRHSRLMVFTTVTGSV